MSLMAGCAAYDDEIISALGTGNRKKFEFSQGESRVSRPDGPEHDEQFGMMQTAKRGGVKVVETRDRSEEFEECSSL